MAISRDHDLFEKVIKNYWEYFRELEEEFLLVRRYVDFSEKNYTTYSVELLKLFQAVCSEIDVVGKTMANIADSSFKPEDTKNNILKWWTIIQYEYKIAECPFTQFNPSSSPVLASLQDYKCFLLGYEEVHPWEDFYTEITISVNGSKYYRHVPEKKSPTWWSDYNLVKHNRLSLDSADINYDKANLGNVISAFAALYVIERALLDTVGTADDLNTFWNHSHLFVKRRILTHAEMDILYNVKVSEGEYGEKKRE